MEAEKMRQPASGASQNQAQRSALASGFLRLYLIFFAGFMLLALLVLAPYAALWLKASGDVDIETVVAEQGAGKFSLFGSAVAQDFADYKLRLYAATGPEIVALGSSRVMQLRGAWFAKSFVNMGGAAGNLSMLAATTEAMLRERRPRVALLGADFWWFLPQWEARPGAFASWGGQYNYGPANLRKPWRWLLEGRVSLREFLAPLLGLAGHGFRAGRYGIMAQRTDDGFGPDGSWYYNGEITGLTPPWDYRFEDTLEQVERGIKAFCHARPDQPGPARTHLEAFADIYYRLSTRGVRVYVFIPPLAGPVYAALKQRPEAYAHLLRLRQALAELGIEAMDFSDPLLLGSGECEFVDGFHGGEVTSARMLRAMADHWPDLLPYVRMPVLAELISRWSGHAQVPDERLSRLPEKDFMNFGCLKQGTPPGDEENAL